MMTSEDFTNALDDDFFSYLNHFFNKASSYGVKNITFNCVTRKVKVELYQPLEENDTYVPEEYYHNLLDSYKMEDRAKGIYGMWLSNRFEDPSVALYNTLIVKQLEDVLNSSFLVLDDWIPTTNITKFTEELERWGLAGKNYELRYCLLRQMISIENGKLTVDETVTGRYLKARSEQLTKEGLKCFFCFVQLCKIINAKIDKLEETKRELSMSDKNLLTRLLGYVAKGDWQMPATQKKYASG